MSNRIVSKLNRLRAMSMDEISYRVRDICRIQADRAKVLFRVRSAFEAEFTELANNYGGSVKRYLETVPAQRFYGSIRPDRRDSTKDLVTTTMPQIVDQAITEGDRLLAHRVNLMSWRGVVLGKEIDWNRDPISGVQWPRRFWADYDLLHQTPADAKLIQELNRQQHLPRLAKAYFLTGDERYAIEAVRQMESWIEQNPVWQSVNWQSSLEIAIRSLSWIWSIFLLLPSKAFDEDAARRICKSLLIQIDQIYRYPSIFSSPNTHLIGEAAAMFIGGLLFGGFRRAASWRDKGAAILVTEMERQVHRDGVYFELSTYYHCYASDFFMQAMVLARMNRMVWPDWTWSRLGHMLEFVMNMSQADGQIPLVGDDDGGRALALGSENYKKYRDGLCAGAVLFGRSDFKYAAGDFAEETLWLLGTDALPIFSSIQSQRPAHARHFYEHAGYLTQRSDCEQGSQLIFDCGGHGSESGGHAHADALSISVSAGGTPLLVDPGTAVYNCAPEWRQFFRSTAAHNTVVVDGLDQSQQDDTFKWKSIAKTRVNRQFTIAGVEYIDAEHDGYSRLKQPVTHRRKVLFTRPNYWIVMDELRGRGEHTFDFHYHFAAGAKLFVVGDEQKGEIDVRAKVEQTGLQMSVFAAANIRAEVLCGQYSPIQGWTSGLYGERRPAPVFKASMKAFAPLSVLTFVVPGVGNGLRTRRLDVPAGSVAAAIQDGAFEDVCVMSLDPAATVRLTDFNMCGEFFWIRTENGLLRQVLAVNATEFVYAGEMIIRESKPLPHAVAHLWDNGLVIERGEEEGKVYVRDLRDRQLQRRAG